MNQQTQATTSEGRTQKIVYDKEGNITERQLPQDMSYRYQYDSAGRLTAVIGTDDKLLETVAYDRAGRRHRWRWRKLRLHRRRLANAYRNQGRRKPILSLRCPRQYHGHHRRQWQRDDIPARQLGQYHRNPQS